MRIDWYETDRGACEELNVLSVQRVCLKDELEVEEVVQSGSSEAKAKKL